MRHIQPIKTGIATGTVLGAWHLLWACLVALGWAKPIMDIILKLHFLAIDYGMLPFSVGTALTLFALTFAIGAALGFTFALIWNWLAGPTLEARNAKLGRFSDPQL